MSAAPVIAQWGLSSFYGWGVYCLNLALRWPGLSPRPLMVAGPIDLAGLEPDALRRLEPVLAATQGLARAIGAVERAEIGVPGTVIHALGNGMIAHQRALGHNMLVAPDMVGAIFFEDTAIDGEARARLDRYRLIITGSTWNETVLRAEGLTRVATVIQGVDGALFHPPPVPRPRGDAFRIFSGGIPSFRKGHDLVLKAFKVFRQRRPDAVLVTAWQSHWPDLARDLAAETGLPEPPIDGDGRIDVVTWGLMNGLPEGSVIDLGPVPNRAMPAILGQMDCALFPNRGEGGTNLVAMEAMACGLPCVLSLNTGHLDIALPGQCLGLTQQTPVPGPRTLIRGTQGWGESAVEEIVARLDQLWSDPALGISLGAAAAEALARRDWNAQIAQFAALI